MRRQIAYLSTAFLCAASLRGQESVCDLFRDLNAADGRQLVLEGELLISRNLAALGAADCDHDYQTPVEGTGGVHVFQSWPTAVHLRPSSRLPPEQRRQFREAAAQADRLRRAGKLVSASAILAGRLQVAATDDFPAELRFDSIKGLEVTELPNTGEIPVIPICELFQNLSAWKGKRIAVRGESSSTMEGSWIGGRCKGEFYTNGYRWPVALDYAVPAYYSRRTAALCEAKRPSGPPKGWETLRHRYSVIETATYVGRLRMRTEYTAACRESGDYITNGFGHLNGAAAELIVEEVRDVELMPASPLEPEDDSQQQTCQPPNLATLCASASTLEGAASLGCVDRVKEMLSTGGIDSRDGEESRSLNSAIRLGRNEVVRLLLDAGAPVNPREIKVWPPLAEAAHARQIGIMKTLLKAGANVDVRDLQGPYLALYGYFDTHVLRVLLEAGADPNARDGEGKTALMEASGYGYEDAIKLLIEHKADVNLQDNSGRSALMHAAAGNYVDAIPYLLRNRADLYAKDAKGETALDIAQKSRNEVAVEMLSAAIQNRQ
jgi:uncharacterized protein